MQQFIGWDVFNMDNEGGLVKIDRVFFVDGMTRAEVEDALIKHDGYPTTIVVEKTKVRRLT